jgi:hypothetical protein
VPVVGVDVQQDRRVGAADVALVATAQRAVSVRARVRADDEDVLALRRNGRPVLGEAVGAEGVDVAVQLQMDPAESGRAEQEHGQGHDEGDPQGAPSAARRPCLVAGRHT